jgi:hypothetical protein
MKRAMFSAFALVVVAALCGCRACQHRQQSCACSGDGCAQTASCSPCGQSCDNGGDPNACNDPGQKCRRPLFCRGRDEGDGEPVAEQPVAAPGPPVGAVTYPYYTVRGPRDFLAKNPPSIGP